MIIMKIRKNDPVIVIAGKDRGKTGKVRRVLPKHGRIIVEGVSMIKKHMRRTAAMRQAGIVEREGTISASDVMLLCPKCNHPARMGYRILEDGKKVRQCSACHEVID